MTSRFKEISGSSSACSFPPPARRHFASRGDSVLVAMLVRGGRIFVFRAAAMMTTKDQMAKGKE